MNNTTLRIFQFLNILAAAIEFTYNAGKQSRPYILGALAVAIMIGQDFILGCKYVYSNRLYFAAKANAYRNTVGSYFCYAS